MPHFGYLKVHCAICRGEFDGMRGMRSDNFMCCSRACADECNWRKTLAIMGKDYYPQGADPKASVRDQT